MRVLTAIALAIGSQKAGDVEMVEEFVAGLIYGLIKKDDLTEIEQCLTDAGSLQDEIVTAIHDFEKKDLKDIIAGVEEIGKVITELPADLADCKDMQGDITRIEAWAKIFENPKELVKTVSENFLKNYKDIFADVSKISTDWTAKDYYDAGDDIADILVLTVGAVKIPEQPEDIKLTQW